jgi:hypothetical protein
MDAVVTRLHNRGLVEDEIVKKTFLPPEMVRQIIAPYYGTEV